MKIVVKAILMFVFLVVATAANTRAVEHFQAPGPNVALRKSYVSEPTPNYALTTDDGDTVQLTDGVYAPADRPSESDAPGFTMWGHKEAVGWQLYYGVPAIVTIDLERDTPIAGASFSTSGGVAGVRWPTAVLIAVSEDGRQFQLVGDLVHLSSRYGIRPDTGSYVFAASDLRCHGRYVRLIVPSQLYIFCDEIEIYKGQDELLKQPNTGESVDDVKGYLKTNLVSLAIRNWVERDLFRARAQISASHAPQAVVKRVAAAIDEVADGNRTLSPPPGDHYRSIFPLNDAHRQIFAAMAELRRGEKRHALQVWKTNRWQRLSIWDLPDADANLQRPAIRARMMRNEKRGDAINIANNTPQPITARLTFKGLPGGSAPDYISVRQAEYVAMQSDTDIWDANALPEAERSDQQQWQVSFPAGVSRQLWLEFHPSNSFKPGTYSASVVLKAKGVDRLEIPLELVVEPLDYPDRHTLAFTMWDYAGGVGSYGIKPSNFVAAIAHMQSYGLDVTWLQFFPYPKSGDFDRDDALVAMPDWSAFDAWVASRPDARYYACLIGEDRSNTYAGVTVGTDQWKRRVGSLMRAWRDHFVGLGKDPSQLLLMTIDEPNPGADAERVATWTEAIRAATPEFKLITVGGSPQPQVDFARMYSGVDIICTQPHLYDAAGPAAWEFFNRLIADGHELWFYNCGGGPGASDAYSYFRGQEWKLWLAKGTGTAFWSYGDVGQSPDGSWNTLAAQSTIYTPLYIDSQSVTDGKHWLAIIEGIEDYEYLRMLHDRVTELRSTGEKPQIVSKAQEVLDTVPKQVVQAVYSGDDEICDTARQSVLDTLLMARD